MYDHDRFFTMTGNIFEGQTELGENQKVVERAYRLWIDPAFRQAEQPLPQAAPSPKQQPSAPDDAELLRRMRASQNGAALGALLDGDTAAYGGDHSAADMTLCSSLAFWCAGDPARMDRIFRQSGLMRDKWDSRRAGTTYGAQTIQRALEGCTEFYQSRKQRSGAAPAAGKAAVARKHKHMFERRARHAGRRAWIRSGPCAFGRRVVRQRAGQALGSRTRRRAPLFRDLDRTLDSLRPSGRRHPRRARAREGARPERTPGEGPRP
jgi:hypothetical protein